MSPEAVRFVFPTEGKALMHPLNVSRVSDMKHGTLPYSMHDPGHTNCSDQVVHTHPQPYERADRGYADPLHRVQISLQIPILWIETPGGGGNEDGLPGTSHARQDDRPSSVLRVDCTGSGSEMTRDLDWIIQDRYQIQSGNLQGRSYWVS